LERTVPARIKLSCRAGARRTARLVAKMGYDLPATCPSAHTGDTPKRLCTAMCQPKQAAVHCTWCKCSSCAFCLPAPPPPPPLPPPPPVPPGECRSEKSEHGDSTKAGCSPWCKLKDCTVWCKCLLKGPLQCDGGPPPAVTLWLWAVVRTRRERAKGLGSTVGTCFRAVSPPGASARPALCACHRRRRRRRPCRHRRRPPRPSWRATLASTATRA
jgi:hypothetical protein